MDGRGIGNIGDLGSGPSIGRPTSVMTAYHVHVFFVWTLLALISPHVMAALFHHFVFRDPILVRMVPVLGRGAGSVSDSCATANSQLDRLNEPGASVVRMEER